jgi:tetratricopeptide (TPR) repeat protein
MTDGNDRANVSVPALQEALAILLRILGGIAGAASLIFGIGFVVVNLSLLKYGVYEGALLRERYVAAGISYTLLLAAAAIIALAARSLSVGLLGHRPILQVLVTISLMAGTGYVLAAAAWGFKAPSAFSRGLLLWFLGSGCLTLFFLFVNPSHWRRDLVEFLRGLPPFRPSDRSPRDAPQALEPPPEAGESEDLVAQLRRRAQSPGGLISLGIIFFVLLITYGQYVYDTLPAALGGGLPVVVQFAGDEENMAVLAGMGVPLDNASTSGQLEFIGQTDSRYFIFVREINWEESPTTGKIRVISRRTALAFDKTLVLGVRYYPSEYHLSDDFAAVTHVQQGDELAAQEFYDGAIEEYSEALRRQPDFYLAFFRRGQANMIKAGNALDESERALLADLAVEDMAKASKLNRGEALYWYHLARAQALARKHDAAVQDLRQAIERDVTYRDRAGAEPLFEDLKVREDLDFGFEELVFGSVLEAARAYATQGQDRYAAAREADDEQVRSEQMAAAALAYTRAISLTATAELPLEKASYRDSLATIYSVRGDLEPAVAQWELAVEAAADNESYRLQLARAYTDLGRLADAVAQYEEVLKRNDQNLTAWLGKGEALRRQGDYRQAASAFEQASQLAPAEAGAWYGLGVVRLAFAPAEAEIPLRRAVTLDPARVADIRQFLERAELETAVRERLEAVLEAAEAVVRGDAALKTEDLAQAIDAYRSAVEADPVNVNYLVKLGDAYRSQGDAGAVEAYAQAATIYRRLIEQDPGDSSYHFRLATVQRAQGEDADALKAYNTAISLAPEVASYFAARAGLYAALGRYTDAVADFRQATVLEPGNYLYYGRLGQLFYDQAQYDQAIDTLTSATGLNPQYATGFYYLGLAHLALGKPDAARTAFSTCDQVSDADESQRRRCQDQLSQLSTPTP